MSSQLIGLLHTKFELPEGAITVSAGSTEAFIWEGVELLCRVIQDAQKKDSVRHTIIGLSGGSTPGPVYAAFRQLAEEQMNREKENNSKSEIDFSRIIFFIIDERYISNTHKDSNERMIRETLGFGKYTEQGTFDTANSVFKEHQLITPNTNLPLEECIKDYDQAIANLFAREGSADLVILGLGPDYHTASLFPPISDNDFQKANDPNVHVLHTTTDRFAVKDRISVSFHVLTRAKTKCFLLNGKDKLVTWTNMINSPNQSAVLYPALAVIASGGTYVLTYPLFDQMSTTSANKNQCTGRLANLRNQVSCDSPMLTDSPASSTCSDSSLAIIVMGASGDLAKKKTYPAIFSLFCEGLLPENTYVVGYARSNLTMEAFWESIVPQIKTLAKFFTHKFAPVDNYCEDLLARFKSRCTYISGGYQDLNALTALNEHLNSLQTTKSGRRILYLALPPHAFASTVTAYRQTCWSQTGWNRVVVEKPFGKDSESSAQLSTELMAALKEDEIFRIDHYLGKEMTLSIFSLRFANTAIMPIFHRNNVQCVRITFKEDIGTFGRGGYFDQYGIIRDVMQNHMLQLLTLIAMEPPASTQDEDIRDEKVKVLRQMPPIELRHSVIGQYVASADGKNPGYLEDSTVPKDSRTPTFCTCALWVQNDRWNGVPFIMKAGKALEKRGTEIRIQLKPVANNLFAGDNLAPNELVILLQPREAVYIKLYTKKPGLTTQLNQTELDLSVMDRFQVERLPDAYERLLLDVIRGDKRNFVRTDELWEAWRIFTPLLHEMEKNKQVPLPYKFGTHGPEEAYKLIQSFYAYHQSSYTWVPPKSRGQM